MRLESHALTVAFALTGLIALFIIARAFRKWHLTPSTHDSFDVHDLFMENGRASKGAVVMMGAFMVTSWFFIYYTLSGKMTEGYFVIYAGAWITPVVAKLISNAPAATLPEKATTTTTTTTKIA